ncbi:MAG: T9SS type A sorting domain-containing protein [Bacteroidia bacterium]|nr:T9SS type A sorting domain-containing protein [Bacteroidia bacterium]
MKKSLLLLLFFVYQISNMSAQVSSPTCITATPFSALATNIFPSVVNGPPAEVGPNYGCLMTQPNQTWFYFKMDSAGSVIIDISQTTVSGTGVDVDFICWGPFTSSSAPCTAQLDTAHIIDCSYSTNYLETVNVPAALAGEYYFLLITNFANQPANVTFSVNNASTGVISVSETCITHPNYNSPVCINGTLQLLATHHFGLGTYSWTGPNSFASALQDPVIPSVSLSHNGYYYINYVRDSTCNNTDSVWVNIDTCGTLTGTVFADGNSNCSIDTLEGKMGNVQLKLTQGGNFIGYAWTDIFGYYYFNVLPGNYTLEVVPSPAHPITCPASMAHAVNVSGMTITTENFAVDCNAIDFAAVGILVNGTPFFPGQTHAMYPLTISNGPNCNAAPVPGQVVVILDPLVSYTSPLGTPPDVIVPAATGDTLKWNVADISLIPFFGYTDYPFMFTTSTAATIGDTVHITLMALPLTGDADPANNIYTADFVVGNSYDPNIKEVVPAGIGASGFIPANTPELEYTIHFQNTGTAAAHNIYILDTLDADVDINTLKIITSSHLQTTTLLPGNVLKFNFSNIMLPDSTSNEAGSHGFVKYTIAPMANLNPGDEITNTAYIYFDFNAPIVTNTALNTIEFLTGMTVNNNYQLGVFPNPTSNSVDVVFEDKQSQKLSVKLLTVSGQLVYEENLATFNGKYTKKIDLSAFAKGVYMLQISTDKQVVHKKIIKN